MLFNVSIFKAWYDIGVNNSYFFTNICQFCTITHVLELYFSCNISSRSLKQFVLIIIGSSINKAYLFTASTTSCTTTSCTTTPCSTTPSTTFLNDL